MNFIEGIGLEQERLCPKIHTELLEAKNRGLIPFSNLQSIDGERERKRVKRDIPDNHGMLDLLGNGRNNILLDDIRNDQKADKAIKQQGSKNEAGENPGTKYARHVRSIVVVRPAGIEPATLSLEG